MKISSGKEIMDKIGGFDPNAGISWRLDGETEIGRSNLPPSMRLLPGESLDFPDVLAYGNVGASSLMERFKSYFSGEPRFRELLSPDVFFEVLENAAESFEKLAAENAGDPACRVASERIASVLADHGLCEALRKLVLEA